MEYDYTLLEQKIKAVCGSKENFAAELGIARTSLYSKLTGRLQFRQNEIKTAMQLLHIRERHIALYFFTLKVRKAEHGK